jgi:protein-tyrosine phosphatase
MHPILEKGQRVLQVEGAYNVRDLGGYATKDGRTTQWGVYYRADGMHRLSDESRHALVNMGVGKVIDLRHLAEIEAKRNVFTDDDRVDYHHISLINPVSLASKQIRCLGDLYVGMLEGSQAELRRVFALLAESGGADLFHCSAGKDRTGVVSVLLLELAGVPHETIKEDFSLTAACLAPIMHEFRSERPADMPEELYENFIGCDPANMDMMLQHLQDKYTNAERYLLSIGLSEEQIQAIKDRFVEQN